MSLALASAGAQAPLQVTDDAAGWRTELSAAGVIQTLEMKRGGRWRPVEFRRDQLAGPAWSIVAGGKPAPVALSLADRDAAKFVGKLQDVLFTLQYKSVGGRMAIVAGMKNEGTNAFKPGSARLTLGINTEMVRYPEWNGTFFPTLLRCEKTHLWGYLMTPEGRILLVASPDPVASWSLSYNRVNYGAGSDGGHRIYTLSLDLLNAPPLPPRHPDGLGELPPGAEKSWTIFLHEADVLECVKPLLAAMLGAPMIEADRYTLAEGETSAIAIFSGEDVTVTASDPAGRESALTAAGSGEGKYTLPYAPNQGPGVYTLIVRTVSRRQAEAKLSVRRPWSWYLRQARKEAIRCGQRASSHFEQWLGLYSGVLARRHFPDAEQDARIEQRLNAILNLQWDIEKKTPKHNPHGYRHVINTAAMMGVLADRYKIDRDIRWLEIAGGFADYIAACQHPDGYYAPAPDRKTIYTSVYYPAKAMMEVMAAEKSLGAGDAGWRARYSRHYASVKRAMEHLVRMKDNIETEGELTFEDGMISCTAAQLAMFALLQEDPAQRRVFSDAAARIASAHRCLEQLLIPDSRMNGATLRFWEAQYDVLIRNPANMINSPHGWSAWRIYAAWYLYQLTGEEERLRQTMNALGACAQVIDAQSGELRWAFVPDPYIPAEVLVRDPQTPGRGRYVKQIIGEQYLPMISDFHYPEKEPVWGNAANTGWTCDNDVHEIFKCLEEVALTSAYVIERASGEIAAWNCRVKRKGDALAITPNEAVVSRVHLNLRNKRRIEIAFGSGEKVSGDFEGLRWAGPGGAPEDLR